MSAAPAGLEWAADFHGERSASRRARALAVFDRLLELHRADGHTLTELAGELALSRPVVDAGVTDLIELGWVRECPPAADQTLGRPARRFRLASDLVHVAGIDVDTEAIRVLIADLSGSVVGRAERSLAADTPSSQRLAATRKTLMTALRQANLRKKDLQIVAIGTTGIVEESGTVTLSTALPGWSGIQLGAEAAAWVPNARVIVENDVRLAALADQWRGALRATETGVFILTGLRSGIALVVDGHLHRGAHRAAGEIGALPSVGWERAIVDAPVPGVETTAQVVDLVEAAHGGEASALQRVDDFADTLVDGLAAVCLVVDPQHVVVGSRFADLPALLAPRLDDRLKDMVLMPAPVLPSSMGPDGVALGAIRYALRDIREAMDREGAAAG